MNNNFMAFLGTVSVADVDAKASRTTTKKQNNPNPTFLGIRIWKDGSVFPSQAAVEAFGLEYPAATVSSVAKTDGTKKTVFTVVGNQGNGLDVIDTRLWNQLIGAKQHFIAVGIAPKNSAKLDLFGLTRYDEAGKPSASVLDQGSNTFGKAELLPLIKELYGVEPNEEGFIDLQIVTVEAGGKNLQSTNGVEYLPKKVARGEDKGKPSYEKREKIDIFMLFPAVEVATAAEPNGQPVSQPAGIAEEELAPEVDDMEGADTIAQMSEKHADALVEA